MRATVASQRAVLVSWEMIREAGVSDKEYYGLLYAVGSDEVGDLWDSELVEYRWYMAELTSVDGIILFRGRIVVPKVLRPDVLASLHRAHQGTTGMTLRAQDSVWWPQFTADLEAVREGCMACRRNAPSQPALPPVRPSTPDYPFQMISSDYFAYGGKNYLVIVDRYNGWPVVRLCREETAGELVTALWEFFCVYGTPEEIATDGASVYTAEKTRSFLEMWGVKHRVLSAYNPHANLRAETAVRTMKRWIQENVGPKGSLDTDKMAWALLAYRNTPDRDTARSPAQVLYAR